MVEVGGEVRCGGKRSDGNPWRIAIDRPIESEDGLTNANSSNCRHHRCGYLHQWELPQVLRRGWRQALAYHQPFNGYPVQHGLLSATVHAVSHRYAARSPRRAWSGGLRRDSASLKRTASQPV